MLGQWIAIRAYGLTDHLINQLKSGTIISYFLILHSYHVDRRINTIVFDSPYLLRLVQRARSFFSNRKHERLLITKDILL